MEDTVIHAWTNRACVRSKEWACIVDTINESILPLLFNRRSDPDETIDVASNHPGVVKAFQAKLTAFLGQPLPITYQHQPDTRTQSTLARHLQIRQEKQMNGGN